MNIIFPGGDCRVPIGTILCSVWYIAKQGELTLSVKTGVSEFGTVLANS